MAELMALVIWAALLTRIAWKVAHPGGRAVAVVRPDPVHAGAGRPLAS